MALAGIVLSAFSLRLAVSGVSPVLDRVREDVALDAVSTGVLAMMPTFGFALTGFLTAAAMRRVSLEALLTLASALAAVGLIARAASSTPAPFLGFSLLIMIGLGIGNVTLPPIIKKYFRDHIAPLTATFSMLLGLSTAAAPFFAVPLADAAGWRFSIGSWAIFSLAAFVPWLLMWVSVRRDGARAASSVVPDAARAPVKPWRSPIGWGLVLLFVGTSSNTFSMFTWLPRVITSYGFTEHQAGLMLSYYAILGIPVSLVVPLMVRRVARTTGLGLTAVALYALGYLGLLLWPTAHWGPLDTVWVWITIFGLAQASFPLALTLINARTRTTAGAGALSGFGQGAGYLAGCVGPLIFGVLFTWGGSWWTSFGYLWLMLLALTAGVLLTGRRRFLEDRSDPDRTVQE
ncbi:MFS transporter [Kocuria sp. cx-116]|nr:MFS transporter [Kocuria sp. cx-116]